MILVTKWFGAFLCEEGKVTRAALFPKDSKQIALRLDRIRKGEVLEEELELGSSAKEVTDRRLIGFGRKVKFDSSFIKPEDYGYSLDLYRQATIDLAKQAVRERVGPDVHLGQAVRAYDDLVFTNNMLSERLHEWYGLHFPELEVVVGGDEYSNVIVEHGERSAIMAALGLKMDSIGSDIAPEDLNPVRTLASALRESYASRERLERYINARMKEVAPNVSALAGPVIGARLIMHVGSLARLATLPSGTIQLLGAEKAMFRHLKEGSRPPKHGILFQHPMVHNAPGWQRGAIARALASKICLAARADAFTRNDISALLRTQLEKRIAEIKKQHPAPLRRAPGKKRKRIR
ncbi:MAG: NOP5/NOP56 family protein [Thermoplasmata archaeon]